MEGGRKEREARNEERNVKMKRNSKGGGKGGNVGGRKDENEEMLGTGREGRKGEIERKGG
jgi:hypothetical protein